MRLCTPSVFLLVLLVVNNNATDNINNKQFEFVPDVVHYSPDSVLSVQYGDLKVELGNELTPTQVKNPPKISWLTYPQEFYTLCMTDPDAPSRQEPKFREFLHWLVVNIPGSDIDQGERLAQYVGSGPPKDTGLHRYVFLLFKQPSKLKFDELRRNHTSRAGRKNFSIQNFANKYNLDQPAKAGNYYLAKWDNYVPILHEELSGK